MSWFLTQPTVAGNYVFLLRLQRHGMNVIRPMKKKSFYYLFQRKCYIIFNFPGFSNNCLYPPRGEAWTIDDSTYVCLSWIKQSIKFRSI